MEQEENEEGKVRKRTSDVIEWKYMFDKPAFVSHWASLGLLSC